MRGERWRHRDHGRVAVVEVTGGAHLHEMDARLECKYETPIGPGGDRQRSYTQTRSWSVRDFMIAFERVP